MSERSVHSHGKTIRNVVTPERVEERARELALIAGRGPNERTTSDWRQAKEELLGDEAADAAADEPDITGSGMGGPPTSHGHQTGRQLPTDDRDEERMVEKGLERAEHSEMLEAGKHPTRNEE